MATTTMNYGLEYKPGDLETLKVLSPSPEPPLSPFPGLGSASVALLPPSHRVKQPWTPPPIRLLPPSLFTHLHRQHLLSHPPDHVLFPFLHGLEGDNEAQNTFFANVSAGSHWVVGVEVPVIPPGHARMPQSHASIRLSMQQGSQGGSSGGAPGGVLVQHHQLLRPKVPRYRGLVWVVCEEDVKSSGDKVTLSVLRRKPLPRGSDEDEAEVVDHDDEDLDFETSDDSWAEDTSESSWEEGDEDDDNVGLADDERDGDVAVAVVNADDPSATVDALGALAATKPSTLVKSKSELTKDEMDSMPYMHPVVSPHSQSQSPHHPSLSSINTSIPPPPPESDTDTSSVSPSVFSTSSSVDAGTTSSAPTSVSASPVSASPSGGYPQVIALEEVVAPPPVNIDTKAAESKKKNKQQGKVKDTQSALGRASGKKEKGAKKAGKAKQTDPAAPPLLTCTFRPKELLRKRRAAPAPYTTIDMPGDPSKKGYDDQEVIWEFVPARVPDGISLRNFGIQMPVYATISDIVIYSPQGPTKASIALAERFREAIARKRRERVDALKGVVYQQIHGNPAGTTHFIKIEDVLKAEKARAKARRQEREDTQPTAPAPIGQAAPRSPPDTTQNSYPTPPSPSPSNSPEPSDSDSATSDIDEDEEDDLETRMLDTAERYLLALVEDDLLDYNVFVLDGGEEELRKMSRSGEAGEGGLAHLMMRSCGSGVPGGADHGRLGVVPPAESARSQKGRTDAIAKMMGRKTPTKTGPHTIGRDGELQGEREVEARADAARASVERMDVDSAEVTDIDMDCGSGAVGIMDVDMDGLVDVTAGQSRQDLETFNGDSALDAYPLFPNTVDFALREKEEMRDLTKASEIISLFPLNDFKPGSAPNSQPGTAFPSKGWTASLGTASPSESGALTPSHLQHLAKLMPPSPSRSASQVQETGSPAYTFTHPDTSVDISSPVTFFDARVGQVFLGNSGDVPLSVNAKPPARVVRNETSESSPSEDDESQLPADDPFNYLATNDPASGLGYDICVECHEMAPFPTAAHLRAAEEHLGVLEAMWKDRCVEKERSRRRDAKSQARAKRKKSADEDEDADDEDEDEDMSPILVPARPPPHANAVVHLPFPSSPPNTQTSMQPLLSVVRFLEKYIKPVPGEVKIEVEVKKKARKDTTPTPGSHDQAQGQQQQQGTSGVRRWSSSVASLMPSVFGGNSNSSEISPPLSTSSSRSRSFTTPTPSSHQRSPSNSSGSPTVTPSHPTRPLKVLLYSADGYTESSLAALCMLMHVKGLSLPEAYLDLQVGKRRSFFVYQHDLGILRRVETRLLEDRERERERLQRERERQEMERMVREAREREARERIAREERQRADERSAREEEYVNANGKRTIGSVHAGTGGPPEKHGGLNLFKMFGAGTTPNAASTASQSTANMAGDGTTKNSHAFKGRPAAKSVSFGHPPPWAQRQPSAVASSSSSHQSSSPPAVRLPPTIAQGIPIPSSGGRTAIRPPEELVGSLPRRGMIPQQDKSSTLPSSSSVTSLGGQPVSGVQRHTGVKRPRANTSPWLPSFHGGDHQSWFNDPRFDGSFPSRVLPFLYLGNLNHASNVYMLHALGITHVVSVGECALLPPPYHMVGHPSSSVNNAGPACAPRGNGAQRSGHGSLWIEEREGRIKVLDIKGVCDDGIDTLEPQLEPICDWIDKAREEGGQVLVHCRVGVSRSATVTIAYVMKHLSLPLVDAYLIVRSRRLSVLIQPNMRLLYNLCGWEIKLAKERANWVDEDDNKNALAVSIRDRWVKERRLERELARTLTWPYLSMEVHKLNEKYLTH
ncbi:hypothetical protein NMY22_g8515 [Coprinellus aureogranulatus]|nr:hypothetical protein NMY22_g8515 [Coprinellus aureogranulatus]